MLQGERYAHSFIELVAKLGQIATSGSIIAQKQILNTYPGIVKFNNNVRKNEIDVLNFSQFYKMEVL